MIRFVTPESCSDMSCPRCGDDATYIATADVSGRRVSGKLCTNGEEVYVHEN